MKAALYVRVSKLELNIDNQEKSLISYCSRGYMEDGVLNPIEIFKVYRDEGVSGAKSTRPQLDIMLQDMRDRKFEAVIIWKLDRLGRSLQHLLQLLGEFNNLNIRLIIATMNMDTKSAAGRLFFQIAGAFAEFERELIKERTISGLDRAKAEGKKLGRPMGSKDKRARRRSGYWLRYKQNTPHENDVSPIGNVGI